MVVLLLLVTLPACAGQPGGAEPVGADDAEVGVSGADSAPTQRSGTPARPGGPDGPVGTTAPTGPQPDDAARLHPDAVDRRRLPWNRVEVLGPRTLRVHLVLGAPPCSVLAAVEVDETPQQVRIATFEGREPGADCDGPVPPLGAPRHLDVTLDDPLDGREIVDDVR